MQDFNYLPSQQAETEGGGEALSNWVPSKREEPRVGQGMWKMQRSPEQSAYHTPPSSTIPLKTSTG